MRSRKPTLEDVAALAGVSQATISRLLNGHTEVCTAETAQKIYEAIIKIGYESRGKAGRRPVKKIVRNESAAPAWNPDSGEPANRFRPEELTSLITTK